MPTNKIQTGLRLSERTYEKARALSMIEQRSLNNLDRFKARISKIFGKISSFPYTFCIESLDRAVFPVV